MKHNSRLLLLLLLLFTVRFEQEDDENQQDLAEETVVFSKASDRSNGLVSVAAYGPNWRSLLFNEVEQGLAFIH